MEVTMRAIEITGTVDEQSRLILMEGERMRQVIIYPGEDGYWVAECPSLPPCINQEKTREEANVNIKEAIQLYIEVLEQEGRPILEDRLVDV